MSSLKIEGKNCFIIQEDSDLANAISGDLERLKSNVFLCEGSNDFLQNSGDDPVDYIFYDSSYGRDEDGGPLNILKEIKTKFPDAKYIIYGWGKNIIEAKSIFKSGYTLLKCPYNQEEFSNVTNGKSNATGPSSEKIEVVEEELVIEIKEFTLWLKNLKLKVNGNIEEFSDNTILFTMESDLLTEEKIKASKLSYGLEDASSSIEINGSFETVTKEIDGENVFWVIEFNIAKESLEDWKKVLKLRGNNEKNIQNFIKKTSDIS